MKTRNGFVSNSSTSSFVIVTTKETLFKVYLKFKDSKQEFIHNYFGDGINKELDGKAKIVFLGEICTEDLDEGEYDTINKFLDSFNKFKDSFSENE